MIVTISSGGGVELPEELMQAAELEPGRLELSVANRQIHLQATPEPIGNNATEVDRFGFVLLPMPVLQVCDFRPGDQLTATVAAPRHVQLTPV